MYLTSCSAAFLLVGLRASHILKTVVEKSVDLGVYLALCLIDQNFDSEEAIAMKAVSTRNAVIWV